MTVLRHLRLASGLAALALAGVCLLPAPRGDAAEPAAGGWVNLMPDDSFTGWKRILLPPEKELKKPSPWRVDRERKVLVCDGVGAKEMLLREKPVGDGVLRVEWRFLPVADREAVYNSGIYVRCSPDGKVWHQAQVAHTPKVPRLGDLFGDVLVDGKLERFQKAGVGHELAHPPGQWNTYEVTCKGKTISVAVNGKEAVRWDECSLPRGCLGLQAEFFAIEFRSIKLRELK